MREINLALLKLSKRAEKAKREHLIESFVDIGPLFTLLSNSDNQILYGRRGTGKTHVLSYLSTEILNSNKIAVQLDMRTIGSTGGIYSDTSLPLSERATRLLVDVLCEIHEQILNEVINEAEELNLAVLGPILDKFIEASTAAIVDGTKKTDETVSTANTKTKKYEGTISLQPKDFKASVSNDIEEKNIMQSHISREGQEKLRIHFNAVGNELRRVVSALPDAELWIILDEWSEIPLDLQPYLADLLRRVVFPVNGVSVKIAAIEQRCRFRISDDISGNIGIEIGADAAASIDLDEFLVFDNDTEQAKLFFQELLFKHIKVMPETENYTSSETSAQLMNEIFTTRSAFEEFVRASEGVPRDAINIISIAAQKAIDNQINANMIRASALTWYTRTKLQAVAAKENAQELLTWIIDEVIKHRQAKAFLIPINLQDELIDFLYDERILHLIKQGVSAQDYPGKRFNVYSLDFGCYVDLINTSRMPKGLFEAEEDSGEFIQVPLTDFRSIRRAILDISGFYKTVE